MRASEHLDLLIESGAIDEVIRPLMAGKEAEVYLVVHQGRRQVAKIYKQAQDRSFKHRAVYTEGRKVRSSRSQRAMSKRSRFGRAEEEEAWRVTEVDMLYRAWDAGVRVPQPLLYQEGVLVMELVCDERGEPAPRMVDMRMRPQEAERLFLFLVNQVQRLLCAGIVHGDLSDFNVLMGMNGPVIIDFPQAVDPAHNNNARKLLVRDVRNLSHFLGRWAPQLKRTRYGEEMWALYEKNRLEPETELTGRYTPDERRADVSAVLNEIADAAKAERRRRAALGLEPLPDGPDDTEESERQARAQALAELARIRARKQREDAPPAPSDGDGDGSKKRRRRKKKGGGGGPPPAEAAPKAQQGGASRRRRRPRGPGGGGGRGPS